MDQPVDDWYFGVFFGIPANFSFSWSPGWKIWKKTMVKVLVFKLGCALGSLGEIF